MSDDSFYAKTSFACVETYPRDKARIRWMHADRVGIRISLDPKPDCARCLRTSARNARTVRTYDDVCPRYLFVFFLPPPRRAGIPSSLPAHGSCRRHAVAAAKCDECETPVLPTPPSSKSTVVII